MISRRFQVAGLAAFFLSVAVSLAPAQSNVALVIGNGAYQGGKALSTTVADASLMAETMRGAGYDVTELRDVQQRDNGQIMNNFLNKIAEAGGNATVFFYYAGYAAQLGGDNYLIPVDASTADVNDIRTQSLRLGQLLEELAKIPAAARVIVLDASYEHGFGRGTAQPVSPGLAIMQPPAGMAVASAAAPGEIATAEAGTYTRTLVKLMRQPGLELDQILKTTRLQVNQATGGKQTPWSATALLGDVTLVSAPAAAPPVQAVALPAEPPAASPPAVAPPAEKPKSTERSEQSSRKEPKEKRRQAERPRRERVVRESAAPAQSRQAPAPVQPMMGIGSIGIGRRGIGIGIGIGN
jgi:uncharacterized caspase-like protein